MFNPYSYETSDAILMPSFLFDDIYRTKLKVIDKLIYTLYLDRYWLFEANDVLNTNGEVYFYFPDQELIDLLGVSMHAVRSSKSRLKKLNFLEEVHCNGKTKLYLTPSIYGLDDSYQPYEEEYSLHPDEEGD